MTDHTTFQPLKCPRCSTEEHLSIIDSDQMWLWCNVCETDVTGKVTTDESGKVVIEWSLAVIHNGEVY